MKKSRFSGAQIVRILQEASSGSKMVSEVCREHGVSQKPYYARRREYTGIEAEDLRKLRDLERENAALKRLLAEREMEISAVMTVFRKNGWALPSELRERR